jgi:hypothetical protein
MMIMTTYIDSQWQPVEMMHFGNTSLNFIFFYFPFFRFFPSFFLFERGFFTTFFLSQPHLQTFPLQTFPFPTFVVLRLPPPVSEGGTAHDAHGGIIYRYLFVV